MSLTKIGSIGINTGIAFAGVTTITTLNGSDAVLSVGGTVNFVSDVSIGGTVSIAGTLTYEDVTNVDAVGLITARNGVVVGSGITLSKDGDIFATGVTTSTTFSGAFSGSGANITALNASNISSGTVPTARLGSGTASSSTFLAGDSTFKTVTGTTINSNADNRVITGSGTANTLNGESTLTYDSGGMAITGDTDRDGYKITQSGNNYGEFMFNSNRSSSGNALGVIRGEWNSTEVASIYISAGSDTTNKDDGQINFYTSPNSGTGIQNRMGIDANGDVTVATGNLVIGTAGKGIDFSAQTATSVSGASATSEVLDHYEEGTWTAFFQNVSAPTYEAQGGRYTRIGRMVFCDCTIGVASGLDTSDGSAVQVAGLPFTGSAGGGDTCLFSIGRYNNILGSKASSVTNIRYTGGGGVILQEGSNSSIDYNEINSSGYLQMSFAFMIA